jgi:hypothetical protein
MHPVNVPFELLAPGLIFAAGGFYFVVRSALNSLNQGLNRVGQKLRETNAHSANAHYRYSVILLATCPAERRDQIASWLLQSIMGD